MPTHTPEEARARGRYALQNDERIDVLVLEDIRLLEALRREDA